MYVSYDFYKQTFGGAIPEADFSKVEAKAEAVIGYLTYINGDIFAKEDNRVKLAVWSPSTRRAWIEILAMALTGFGISQVALHPEGVDRNQ